MVVLMDVSATGDGDVGSISSDPGFKDESARIDRSLLDIPSSIPSSCIYRCDDFIRTKIADGFYGDVYKVRHRETEEVMVLKMNKPDVEKDNCTMLDEIKLMSHLSHENVIRFLGICVDDSRVHLLCEYVNGGDLEGLLLMHSIHLEWSTRLYLARDIAEGMRYLHKNGVIHRDLTSKNCLIKEKNGWRYAIVADLGLATEIKEQSIVGSPYNMAPELLRGEPYDEKADVFSYGIILCEIIGRVQADPDELPRTHSFGLDVEKFQLMTGDCPHEFLQTALCCCQMLPSSRPTFAETAKHLEFILVGYKFRPDIGEAIDAKPPRTIQSMEKIYPCSKDTKHNYSPAKHVTAAVEDNETSPKSSPPAIIVSTDETSPVMIRSADKRRQSWIASRYKLFNTATDDLVKNTPGKLKSFFHRVLRVQTHYDPSKQKKSKDSAKNRSSSQLKSYSVINSDDENVANHEQASSPNSNVRRFLRRGSSDRDNPSDLGSREDSVDGEVSPRGPRSENALTVTSSRSQPSSPKMLVTPRPSPNSRNPTDSDTLVSKLLDKSNRPRCESTPLFNDSSPEPISRRTASHRECQMNNVDHSSPVVQVDETGKIKNKKSPFWFLKRRESKWKDTE